MLSIPQNIQNETKKVIENVFFEKCKKLFVNTMDHLFYSFSPCK